MPEQDYLIERGIGETRAVLVENGRIIEARVFREGVVPAGAILEARLKSSGRKAIAVAGGEEYLLAAGAPGVTEGARLNIEIVREALGGPEDWKRPIARATDEPARPFPALEGREVGSEELDAAGWPDIVEEARSGIARFAGGELRVSVTPAMTLIDVDGYLPPADLAMKGAAAAAWLIRRHGVAGSIGIDLPTIAGKPARLAVAEAIDSILPRPFERTAMNGFGFLQIVRPRRHASVFELASERATFEALALLRSASRQLGAVTLAAHPSVISTLRNNSQWVDQLARKVGGPVTLRSEPSLSISACHAQKS